MAGAAYHQRLSMLRAAGLAPLPGPRRLPRAPARPRGRHPLGGTAVTAPYAAAARLDALLGDPWDPGNP
ncbi:hypothetical protein SGLAM104S_00481 [Streptomyces glaucescens]